MRPQLLMEPSDHDERQGDESIHRDKDPSIVELGAFHGAEVAPGLSLPTIRPPLSVNLSAEPLSELQVRATAILRSAGADYISSFGITFRDKDLNAAKEAVGVRLDNAIAAYHATLHVDPSLIVEKLLLLYAISGKMADQIFERAIDPLFDSKFGVFDGEALNSLLPICRMSCSEKLNLLDIGQRISLGVGGTLKASQVFRLIERTVSQVSQNGVGFLDLFDRSIRSLGAADDIHQDYNALFDLLLSLWNDEAYLCAHQDQLLKLLGTVAPATVSEGTDIIGVISRHDDESASFVVAEALRIRDHAYAKLFWSELSIWKDRLGAECVVPVATFFSELTGSGRIQEGRKVLAAAWDVLSTNPFRSNKLVANLKYLSDSIRSASDSEISTLRDDLAALTGYIHDLTQHKKEKLPDGSLKYRIAAAILMGGDNDNHGYTIGVRTRNAEITKLSETAYFRPGALKVPEGLSFPLKIFPPTARWTIHPGEKLDISRIQQLRRRFFPLSQKDGRSGSKDLDFHAEFERSLNTCVRTLSNLLPADLRPQEPDKQHVPGEVRALLMRIAKHGDDQEFKLAIHSSWAILARAYGVRNRAYFLERLSDKEDSALYYERINAFLSDLKFLLDQRMVVDFMRNGVPRERIEVFKRESSLKVVDSELGKLVRSAIDPVEVEVHVGAGIHAYDRSWADMTTGSCLLHCGATEDPYDDTDLTVLPLYVPKWRDSFGLWNVLRDGSGASGRLILQGEGPRETLARACNIQQLRSGIVSAVKAIGQYRDQALGGVFQGLDDLGSLDRVLTWPGPASEFLSKDMETAALFPPKDWPRGYKGHPITQLRRLG